MKTLQYMLIFLMITGSPAVGKAQLAASSKKDMALKSSVLRKIPIHFPLDMKGFKRLSSGFGMRFHPILKKKKFHYGVDLAARRGTPIYASASGKVSVAKYSSSYGNYVIIKHASGYSTLYGHMMKRNVKKNQHVKQGAVIGYVGSTGRSTGPHLHYEIRVANRKINPIIFWKTAIDKGINRLK